MIGVDYWAFSLVGHHHKVVLDIALYLCIKYLSLDIYMLTLSGWGENQASV